MKQTALAAEQQSHQQWRYCAVGVDDDGAGILFSLLSESLHVQRKYMCMHRCLYLYYYCYYYYVYIHIERICYLLTYAFTKDVKLHNNYCVYGAGLRSFALVFFVDAVSALLVLLPADEIE